MFKYTKEELERLKHASDEFRNDRNLDDILMSALLKRIENYDNLDIIFDKFKPSLCGCIGPTNNEPYCNCTMERLRYVYRYDIALEYLKRNKL